MNVDRRPEQRFRFRRATVLFAVICGVSVAFHLENASAVEITEVNWGFNGKPVKNRFNLLCIDVDNSSQDIFEGQFQLRKRTSLGSSLGAFLTKDVFLVPGQRSLLRFYPYVTDPEETWLLSWGDGKSLELKAPKECGARARVVLTKDLLSSLNLSNVKSFPEDHFPPMVSATSALHSVLLDHVPADWTEPVRRAFREWIELGGEVHVFQGEDGKFPSFKDELVDLNAPLDVFSVGGGTVYRYRKPLNNVTASKLKTAAPSKAEKKTEESFRNYLQSVDWDASSHYQRLLSSMNDVDHPWGWILLIALFYFIMIFPGAFILGRAFSDYRVPALGLLATILVFSLVFYVVGRRGSGERSMAQSLAIAYALPNGSYDITQWTDVFVVEGDKYEIKHHGERHLYSTCQEEEPVNGIIKNGVKGHFVVDFPPYSAHSFAHRTQLQLKRFVTKVKSWQEVTSQSANSVAVNSVAVNSENAAKLKKSTLRMFPNIPERERIEADLANIEENNAEAEDLESADPTGSPKAVDPINRKVVAKKLAALEISISDQYPKSVIKSLAIHKNYVYMLSVKDGTLQTRVNRAFPVGSFLSPDILNTNQGIRLFQNDSRSIEQRYRGSFKHLILRSLNLTNKKEITDYQAPDDRVLVFVMAKMTEPFFVQNDRIKAQAGYVVYRFDLELSSEAQTVEGNSPSE